MPGPCGTDFPANRLWIELQKTLSRFPGRGFFRKIYPFSGQWFRSFLRLNCQA
jgi:hypothetical protein